MRDATQPYISLGNLLQMNLIELKKADRLGMSERPLRAWVNFLEHWKEGLVMVDTSYEPVRKAMERLKELSADEETRRLAFVRERALRDEISFINDAERRGREEGREEGREAVARNLIAMQVLDDKQIASASGLQEADIKRPRNENRH